MEFFGNLKVGDLFGCWGDIHAGYSFPKWVIAEKEDEGKALQTNQDGSQSLRFLMNKSDKVIHYKNKKDIMW